MVEIKKRLQVYIRILCFGQEPICFGENVRVSRYHSNLQSEWRNFHGKIKMDKQNNHHSEADSP